MIASSAYGAKVDIPYNSNDREESRCYHSLICLPKYKTDGLEKVDYSKMPEIKRQKLSNIEYAYHIAMSSNPGEPIAETVERMRKHYKKDHYLRYTRHLRSDKDGRPHRFDEGRSAGAV